MRLAQAALLAALLVAVATLARARLGIGGTRTRRFAVPRGDAAAGVRYAFTTAFLPRAKESASGHLPWYVAGIVYHAGIFAMLARLALAAAGPWRLGWVEHGLAALFAVAGLCGVALFVRRTWDSTLRAISVPDDFVSNLLVSAALAAAAAAALAPGAVSTFQLAGAALLLYAPLGKLRHMLFLLTSRRLWGEYYGRRGVLP